MKSTLLYALAGLVPLLASCASHPVVLAPVGPAPLALSAPTAGLGYLRVFSKRTAQMRGDDPTWYQHSEYRIYDAQGTFIRYVGNSRGEYDTAPSTVLLPPGHYRVKAWAKDYLWVEVPVIIQPAQTTDVHLDDRWNPSANSNQELVREPNGVPVGWAVRSKG